MSTQVLSSAFPSSVGGGVCSYNNVRSRIIPAVGCLSRVKRCLFVDSRSEEERGDALQQAKQELERLSRHDAIRWNFNFIQEKPIEGGRFDWATTPQDAAAADKPSPQTNVVLRQSQITEFLQPRKNLTTVKRLQPHKSNRLATAARRT